MLVSSQVAFVSFLRVVETNMDLFRVYHKNEGGVWASGAKESSVVVNWKHSANTTLLTTTEGDSR